MDATSAEVPRAAQVPQAQPREDAVSWTKYLEPEGRPAWVNVLLMAAVVALCLWITARAGIQP